MQALSTKAVVLYIGIFVTTFIGKIKSKFSSNFDIEKGWSKRGSSGSFKRTVEVWAFAIKFIFRWLKVKKLEKVDPIQFSTAQTELAIILRDKLLELGKFLDSVLVFYNLLTHSLTHSLANLLTYSLTRSLTHSLTHSQAQHLSNSVNCYQLALTYYLKNTLMH